MPALKDMNVKVNVVTEESKQKVGYTPILIGDDYGSRCLDVDNAPSLFETEEACKDIYEVGIDGCVAIAKVTWKEPV